MDSLNYDGVTSNILSLLGLLPGNHALLMEAVRQKCWQTSRHAHYPLDCHQAACTTLLAAGRYYPTLPDELWVEIFGYWMYGDF